MCGFNGIFAYNTAASEPDERELVATRDHMAARGPDGVGLWRSPDRRCAFGHRRLAIIDLSDRALQPMTSADGALVISYNGEIYNFPQLRRELEAKGRVFRTDSDTEALLHLYALYGQDMVVHLRGMFALAIWDQARGGLFLARDPYGIKPLYYANDGWTFRFASQVKALLAGGRVSRDPEPAGAVGFFLWGSVPEPFTLYRDIRALPAGHSQWVDRAGPHEPKPYVNIAQVLAEGLGKSAGDLHASVRAAALDSVAAHLLADVEVGVFLSAGIDSGALLGLMRDAGQARIRAITLGFDEFAGMAEDEVPLAAEVAGLYGAEHVVRRVGEAEFNADLPAILAAMDQPSIDGVNTWFVAKAAREAGLKVALSGLGGDELLAGYPSFQEVPRWVGWLKVPSAIPGLGQAARALMSAAAPGLADRLPKSLGLVEYGGTFEGAYLLRRALFLPFELRAVLDADLIGQGLARLKPLPNLRAVLRPDPGSAIGRVCALESSLYMKNQLLRDADWAGMAHSLEIRTPLVDIALLRAMAPLVGRLQPGQGKQALAAAPSTPLPASIAQRRKTGFVVPTAAWRARHLETDHSAPSMGSVSRLWAREVFAPSRRRRAGAALEEAA
jgi:asparagine synthase (glutamine-hydrolysing)